jgi:hypothetical protein
VFDGTDMEEINNSRPIIRGVVLELTKYLGEHKDVQRWDFMEHEEKVALLIPKRYVMLSRGKIFSICLLFDDGDQ